MENFGKAETFYQILITLLSWKNDQLTKDDFGNKNRDFERKKTFPRRKSSMPTKALRPELPNLN